MKPSYNGEYKIETGQTININVWKWSKEKVKEEIDVLGLFQGFRKIEKDGNTPIKYIIPDDYKLPKRLITKIESDFQVNIPMEHIDRKGYVKRLEEGLETIKHYLFDCSVVRFNSCEDEPYRLTIVYLPKYKSNGKKWTDLEKRYMIENEYDDIYSIYFWEVN
ncbi:MAG: hypothetical protein H8E71_00330 [Candidatus Marinimicrobia bacterium]|nr:hypothetical protein [Candidatus Neomarinimicrobiota bacterium]